MTASSRPAPATSYITVAKTFRRSENDDSEEMEANAAFIVRACNGHDRLLAAAKNALKFLELLGYHGAGATADAELARAIACAEGGAP